MKLRHGIDIVNVHRVKELIEKHGSRFLNKTYTLQERKYCKDKRRKYEHYAARFAAKEAVIKTLEAQGDFTQRFKEIEVRRKSTGKPYIVLSGKVEKQCKLPKGYEMELSLSHERDYAVASVLLILP